MARDVICGSGNPEVPSHRRRCGLSCNALKILIAHDFVMGRWVMLGETISSAGLPRSPVEVELFS